VKHVDVLSVIDNARFNRYHWTILFWTALIIIFDGYDLVIYGVVLPRLMSEWNLSPLEAGSLGSYALFGMMIGAVAFGSLSDKIGRKRVIAICVAIFSLMTFLNGFVTNTVEFGLCRFIAGLGIGGVMPNVVALMTEYSPKNMRSRLVAIMFSGYSVGGMLSAAMGIWLIPIWGWPGVFYVALIPLLILPVILRFLPESPAFLLTKKRYNELGVVLERIEPSFKAAPDHVYAHATNESGHSVPFVALFKNGRALSTLMFWTSFFMCLLMVYALGSWLPKLMLKMGYELGSSLMFLLVLNFGAIFGAVGGGWLADKLNPRRVLTAFFVIAALSIGMLGFKSHVVALNLLVALAGATTIGTQILLYAYVAQFYPATIRSTGIGWASGVGRTGAICGPLLGGALMSMNLSIELNFYAFAIPGIIAAIAISFVNLRAHAGASEAAHVTKTAITG
jgi:MFS transporter, AAHS family, benzoate transport protein